MAKKKQRMVPNVEVRQGIEQASSNIEVEIWIQRAVDHNRKQPEFSQNRITRAEALAKIKLMGWEGSLEEACEAAEVEWS